MPKQTRIFRVFVSSTFEDFRQERDYLQQHAFRNLREYCMEKGWQFQAVDLRWGINNEATIDQRTMEICLKEIKRCQELSPRPNFIVLLGERYGWKPLPDQIIQSVAIEMDKQMPEDIRSVFRQWYDLDENQLPEPVYKLRPREGRYIDYEAYHKTIQSPLVAFFTEWATENLPDPDLQENRSNPLALQRLSMERSATEQEIHAGAFQIDDAHEHVIAFIRNLYNCPGENNFFRDKDQEPVNHLRLHIKDFLPCKNIVEFDASWDTENQKPATAHLRQLSSEVEIRLRNIIDKEIARYEQSDEILSEQDAHERFAGERTFGFAGREKDIEAICNYSLSDQKTPLVIWGGSGTGKSTLLAKAAQKLSGNFPEHHIISRFIGVTGKSSNGHTLLTDLCRILCKHYGGEVDHIPDNPSRLQAFFPRYLEKATPEHPLLLFIDALDQFSENDPARQLNWLPAILPDHVKIVLSTLRDNCFTKLKERSGPSPVFYEITPITPEDGRHALDAWLMRANRRLQEHQKEQIINDFEYAGCAPLYLHLAFEHARHWESFRRRQRLGRDIPEMIEELYDSLSRPEAHGSIVEIALTAIRCAKQGLSDDEILGLLADNNDFWNNFGIQTYHSFNTGNFTDTSLRQVPPVLWIRLYHDLEYYLTRRSAPGGEVITFYHRQLAEAVDNVYFTRPGFRQIRHKELADFFAAGNWFVKQDPPLAANARKCDELPWQLIRSGDWDSVTETLCNLDFIQAKASAGMIWEMVQDFITALELIPDNQENIRKENERILRLEKYSRDLADFAKGKIADLEIPESIEPLTGEEMRIKISRMKNNPTRVDLLTAFLNFLGVESENLRNYSRDIPFFAVQQAWNHAADGPVGNSAAKTGKEILSKLLTSVPETRPPWNPLPIILKRFLGHSHFVFTAKVTVNGKLAVSSSGDNSFIIWDIESGQVLRSLPGHPVPVWALCLTSDGKRVLSGSSDNTCTLLDLENGTTLKHLEGHRKPVRSVCITPDGHYALSASEDQTCIFWDVENSCILKTLNGHRGEVYAASLTPDGKHALSGATDNSCILWNTREGIAIRVLTGHSKPVRSVDITPDGKLALSGSDDATCILWDIEHGIILKTLIGHSGSVRSVSMTPDGNLAVSASADNTCLLWDLRTGKPVKNLTGHTGEVLSVSLTPDGKRALSGSVDNTCILWDLECGTEQLPRTGHTSQVQAVNLVPESKYALSGASDHSCILWDVESGNVLKSFSKHADTIRSISIAPNGKLAVSGSDDKTCIIWDLETGEAVKILKGHSRQVQEVVVTPDGNRIVSSSGDKTCIFWNLENGELLNRLTGHTGWIQTLNLTPDGKQVVSGSWDSTIILWDPETGKALNTFIGHSGWIWMVCLTPDSKCIVSASVDNTCILWDLRTGFALNRFTGHENSVRALALTPDGRYAVSGSWDNSCILWDLRSGQIMKTLNGHTGPVWWLITSPDGRRVLSASEDNTCIIWDLQTGKILARYPTDCPLSFAGIIPQGILVGDESGKLGILETSREIVCPEPGIVTARNIWDFSQKKFLGISADCPFCLHRFEPPQTVMEAIDEITQKAALNQGQSPCLELPYETFNNPGLLTDCPFCGERLKFNPFTV